MDINLEEYSEKYGIEFESVQELINYIENNYATVITSLDRCNFLNALEDDELEFFWNKYKIDGIEKASSFVNQRGAYIHQFTKKNSVDGKYIAFYTAHRLSKEHLLHGIEKSKNL